MKTKWQYFFETNDFIFEKEHKFIGSIPRNAVTNIAEETEEKIDFEMDIVPDKKRVHQNSKQTGILFITIPYNYEEGREVINTFLYLLTQMISFDFGEIRVNGGMIMCERLPETPEEREQVGDAPYAVAINFVEAPTTRKFDPKKFTDRSNLALDIRLVAQHNESRKSQNEIEKFLGFFKILESQFPPQHKKQSLQQCLETNNKLYMVYAKAFKFASEEKAAISFKEFIKSIVHARHRCAHLKIDKNFGYLPADPKIKEEIVSFLLQLEILTYETIQANVYRTLPIYL